MAIDPTILAKALERYRARQAEKEARRRDLHDAGPHLDLDLLRLLRRTRTGLMAELARKLGLSRTGLYKAVQPQYGRTPKGKAQVERLNGILNSLKEEVIKSLNRDDIK